MTSAGVSARRRRHVETVPTALGTGLLGMAISGAMGAVAGDELFEWAETFVMPWS